MKERLKIVQREKFLTTKNLVRCALFAAMLCVLSPFSIPIGPIPITLSVFAVMLCAVVLETKLALVSVVVYILLGLIGLPVFSAGKAGFSVLVGPTGGYIWSYILMVLPIGLMRKLPAENGVIRWVMSSVSCVLALVICYAAGTIQFMLLQKCGFAYAISVCVIPFIPFDLCKAAVALILGTQIRQRITAFKQ